MLFLRVSFRLPKFKVLKLITSFRPLIIVLKKLRFPWDNKMFFVSLFQILSQMTMTFKSLVLW